MANLKKSNDLWVLNPIRAWLVFVRNRMVAGHCLLFFCLVLMFSRHTNAQNEKFDTLRIKANHYLLHNDSILPILKDTVIVWPSQLKYRIRRNPTPFTERRLIKPFWEMVYHHDSSEDTTFIIQSELSYLAHQGKKIRKIIIRRMGPASNSIYDTTRRFQNDLEHLIDALHIDTREWVIRNYLMFAVNDTIDPYRLADNERALRQLPFLVDARIYLQNIQKNSSAVDVLVLTKDIWSIGGDAGLDGLNGGRLRIAENNWLGMGQQISLTAQYTKNRNPQLGIDAQYIINNLFKSFINTEVRYTELNTNNNYGLAHEGAYLLRLSRPFLTPTMRLGGGLETSKNWSINVDRLGDSLYTPYVYLVQDIWLGLNSNFIGKKIKRAGINTDRIRTELGIRILQQHFTERPEIRLDTNQNYFNTTLHLGNIGVFKRNYYKTRYLLGFGRTEDMPYGYIVNASVGWERREFQGRWYSALEFVHQKVDRHMHYWDYSVRFGCFYRQNKVEQGQFDFQLIFYSRLLTKGKFRFRYYVKNRYTWGINRLAYEGLTLNNDNGIRGFNTIQLIGNQRFVFNLDGLLFFPKPILGFRFALLWITDAGWLGDKQPAYRQGPNPIMAAQNWVLGVGFGLRIRNENLIFKTVELRTTVYPFHPSDVSWFSVGIAANLALKIRDFVGKPSLFTYQ